MKESRALTPLVLIAFLACAIGAPAAPPHQSEAASWAAYTAKARKELKSLDAQIDALQARAKAAGADARQGLERDAAALRAQKGEADKLLAKLEASAGKARKELKVRLDRTIRDLKAAYRDAMGRPEGSASPAEGGT